MVEYQLQRIKRHEKPKDLRETIWDLERKVHPGFPDEDIDEMTKVAKKSKEDADEMYIIRFEPGRDESVRKHFGIKSEIKEEEEEDPEVEAAAEQAGEAVEADDEDSDDEPDEESEGEIEETQKVNREKVKTALASMQTATSNHLDALQALSEAVPEMSDQGIKTALGQVPHLTSIPTSVENIFNTYGAENFQLMLAVGQYQFEQFRQKRVISH